MAALPPPIIDSFRLVEFAFNDDNVRFTGRLAIYVGGENDLNRLAEVAGLALCRSYARPKQLYLLFWDADWSTQAAFPYTTIEEAKLKAELGYEGLRSKWTPSPYSEEDECRFLREEYQVDPKGKWWEFICSFCGRSPEGQCVTGKFATICQSCVSEYHKAFVQGADA